MSEVPLAPLHVLPQAAGCPHLSGAPQVAADVTAAQQGAPRLLLTIAGHDPCSGAGLTADLKVFAAHGYLGLSAPTALTVQSTRGVRRVEPVAAGLLLETLQCLAEDALIDGIKIGMLATKENVAAVVTFLRSLRSRAQGGPPVVLDPVLRSSSGRALLEPRALELLLRELLPLTTCLTPNSEELALLAGGADAPATRAPEQAPERRSPQHIPEQARESLQEHALTLMRATPGLSIVATGGHLLQPEDCVFAPGEPAIWIPGAWVQTAATHGTGCAHSSAVLCGLVSGLPLLGAAVAAKAYVTAALQAARPYGGGGAMDHFFGAQLANHRLGAAPVSDPEHAPSKGKHPQRRRTRKV